MKKLISEAAKMQKLAGLITESQYKKLLKEEQGTIDPELLSFTNEHLEELKDYFRLDPEDGYDSEDVEEREQVVDSIERMVVDAYGDAVCPDQEIGVSIKFTKDADDGFLGAEGDKPTYFTLGGRKMAAIWYNI